MTPRFLLAMALVWPGIQEVPAAQQEDLYVQARERMVAEQITARGVRDPRVLDAMRRVPREAFVQPLDRQAAYDDRPLPIGEGQTIYQPYIVALMTELAAIQPDDRVLEIGTGSGYQAAVLACLTGQVYSIEIIETLARRAENLLEELGYEVHVRTGDGFFGWPEAAPFDAILVTAAAPRVPQSLADQLADGGRLVMPLGDAFQELVLFRKAGRALTQERVIPVRFVPMTGAIEDAGGRSAPAAGRDGQTR